MNEIKFLDLKKQYYSIKDEIDSAIESVLEDQIFIKGKHVIEFENSFSKYIGSKHCIGVGNGTDALEISLKSLNLPENSEIIVPSNSFISTAEAVSNSGYKVIFCDISSKDYSIDLESLSSLINKKTKAIIVVHLYGIPTVMDPILELSKQNNLLIIEDCAQAHGAKYNGKMVGTFGDIGCFSFYPGKNLGAIGDAGAILTNNDEIAEKCRMLANHGRKQKYDHEFLGRNSRLDSIHAAVLSVKLKYLDTWTLHRKKIAKFYSEKLSKIENLTVFDLIKSQDSVYHLYVIRTKYRDRLKQYLNKEKIQTGIHYPIPLNQLKAYNFSKQNTKYFKVNQISKQILSIPISENIELAQADYICKKILDFFNE